MIDHVNRPQCFSAFYTDVDEQARLHDYMGEIFEKMCRHYLLLNSFSSNMVCPIMEVGKWNGTNQRKKEQTDIDVVGLNTVDKKAILGECKFKNSSVDKATLDALQDLAGLIDKKYEIVAYYLFSLSGFYINMCCAVWF